MSSNPPLKDKIVLNASPIIALFKAGLDFVLPEIFDSIVVPDAVWQEISLYDDEAFRGLSKAVWLKRKEFGIENRILVWNLGNGESQVLSWALNNPDFIAVVDDLAARRCAASLNIRCIGTAGLLVLAKRRTLIPSLENALSQVRNAGLYLADNLVDRLIAKEKETR